MNKKVIVAVSALFIILLSTFYGCRNVGLWLVKTDVPKHADVLVILMGSFPERVLEAADLYHEGKAGRLLIVNESMGPYQILESRGAKIVRTTQQAYNSAVALGVPADCITMLPSDARSTMDEALAVRNYIRENPEYDTLLLVSSPFHMRRASMIFNAALLGLSGPIIVGCSPSNYSVFNPDKWWRRKEDIQSVISELIKIGSFQVFEKRKVKNGTN